MIQLGRKNICERRECKARPRFFFMVASIGAIRERVGNGGTLLTSGSFASPFAPLIYPLSGTTIRGELNSIAKQLRSDWRSPLFIPAAKNST